MTIIQNQNLKRNNNSNILVSLLIIILISFSTGGIFVYNQAVNIGHEIENQKIILRNIEVENAELKNKVYEMFSQQRINDIVNNQALVIDKNPEYIKTQDIALLKGIGLAR